MSVPSKLWITYYTLNSGGKIDLKGQSSDVKNVYIFYKNLKQLINNSDIKFYKLEIDSGSIDDIVSGVSDANKIYNFEITNMSDSELNPTKASDATTTTTTPTTTPAATTPAASTQTPQQGQEGSTDQKPGFQLGKPLFGQNKDTPATPAGGSASPPATGGAQPLPKNLEKIEKF